MMDFRQRLPDLIANLRDLSSIRLDNGRTLAPGRMLRSAALAQVPASSLDALTEALGKGTYFDLRTDREVARDGGAELLVARGWLWRRVPVADEASEHSVPLEGSRAAIPQDIAAALTVARMLPATDVAIIGCSLGKDRTGMVVALLLHWLGARSADIAADFMLSNARLAEQRHLLPGRWREHGTEIGLVHALACARALELADVLAPNVRLFGLA